LIKGSKSMVYRMILRDSGIAPEGRAVLPMQQELDEHSNKELAPNLSRAEG
jgi:hypothetical protein